MLYLRNTNQQQTIQGGLTGGIQRGTLSQVSGSIISGCVNYEDTGFISMSGITGGRGPLYNYSVYDLSSSLFITQSTAESSASVGDLSNSTYLVTLSNDGVFAYTQSLTISCPPPPDLQVEYLVVGGGGVGGNPAANGGCGGGVISGSLTIPYRTTLTNVVGIGGTSSPYTNGGSSSISSSTLGFFGAGGATSNKAGEPTDFDAGLGGPEGTMGGGAGSSKDGNSGVEGQNGDGGTGSLWLNGLYYAGGGGGTGGSPTPANDGAPGLGGGGYGSGSFKNGVNGLGGGASGLGTSGGSGVVIFRYSTGSVRPAFGGTTEISGGYVYHTFTGSGDFRYAKS
jgi:hypothetical protein